MRRVLHLRTVCGRGGGPEKTLLFSPRYLTESYEMRLAYIRPQHDPEYDMPQRARQMGVELIDIPEASGFDPRTMLRLARAIREFQPHLLHAHDYKTNLLSVVLGHCFRIPAMTTAHGYVTLGGRLNWYYNADRWALRQMAHIVAVSPDLFQYLEQIGIPEDHRSLVLNAIDTETFQRRVPGAEAKRQIGVLPDRLVVGAVGRLHPEKGFADLIQAAAKLLQEELDFELLIAGDGPLRDELRQLVAAVGCKGRIRLLGHCTDTLPLYEAMDVFALSSLREGLPNVLLEAMAMRVPVVATRVGGVPDLVQSEVNGLIVAPGSIADLTQALGRLLCDAELRQRLADAGRTHIEQQFSFEARMAKIKTIYDHVLERHSSPRACRAPAGAMAAGSH